MSRKQRKRAASGGRRVLGLLLKLTLLCVVWLLGVACWIVWVGERDQAAKADAIVVLGAAAYDARPSPVLEERLRHALDLHRRGYADTLIFTGGYGRGARFSESQVARRYALKQGVPEETMLLESVSRTTYENLAQTQLLMREHHLQRVIVVSDPLHMARALRLCRQLGIDALGSATPSTRFRSFRTQWRFLTREIYFFHRDLVVDSN